MNSCHDRRFLCLTGGNGASFFFSTASRTDWRKSLEFYRAVSWRAFGKKLLLAGTYPLLKRRAALSPDEVAERIGRELELAGNTVMNKNCSAMVSPTRDKAIIHRHGSGYEKIAVGESFDGVAKELEIYRHLSQCRPAEFAYSRLEEVKQFSGEVRFFMKYAEGSFSERIPAVDTLLAPLAEFFRLSRERTLPWRTLWESLTAAEGMELASRISSEDRQGETLVGLVHRDFKPWNVKSGTRPLFFDFESATFDGCPLEDFFNYTVDPLLRRRPPEIVWHFVQSRMFPLAAALLAMQGIPRDESMRYWRWYLLERVVFWHGYNQRDFTDKFLALYDISR